MKPVRWWIVGLALVAAACGSETGDTSSTVPASTPSSTSSSTTTTTTVPDPTVSSTTQAARQPIPDAELPGEEWTFGVVAAVPVAVVGVQFDDVLNVRVGPGVEYDVVGALTPTEAGITITGRARDLGGSIWYELQSADGPGWANSFFLGYRGPTNDTTSLVVARLGSIPIAPTMEELGLEVARAMASTEPPSAITLTVPATVGDLGEITYDVVGLGDDAVWAVRLHVFGEPSSSGFSLVAVEETAYCARGLSPEGLCP